MVTLPWVLDLRPEDKYLTGPVRLVLYLGTSEVLHTRSKSDGYEGYLILIARVPLRLSKFKAFVRGLGAPRLMDLLDHLGKDTPKLIAAWIRSSCGPDAVEQSEASRRKRGGAKKGHAQKMSSPFLRLIKNGALGLLRRGKTEAGRETRHCPTSFRST
jgi:hypothetical protein